MKSLPIPVAQARSNFSEVLDDARKGRRIRLTRHGKPVGWIIGEGEKQVLDAVAPPKKPKARRTSRGR
jgi:prevent-host-death family protein